MKSISPALQSHLTGRVTTTAQLWRVVRRDGQTRNFTTHDQDLVFDGITYYSKGGFMPTAIDWSNDLKVDNLDVEVPLTSAGISEADVNAGRYDGARVRILLVNWADLTMGSLVLFTGHMGETKVSGTQMMAQLRSLSQKLQVPFGRTLTEECDLTLGSQPTSTKRGCGVDLAPLTVSGTVSAVLDKSEFTDGGRTEEANYFKYGLITFTSGANAGLKAEVMSFADGVFKLFVELPYQISPGDEYTVYPGCDKRHSTCKNKFNNVLNFGGFPWVPGVDSIMRYPDAN
jgi:uncharacterized phage protein (TIGR02218 family)